MDNKQLSYFIAIVEAENITKASEKLHIAQPYLSQQLRLLEEELEVKLIERTTRKIHITDAGLKLYHRAKQIVDLSKTTVKELKDFGEGVRGTLSVCAIASVRDMLLPNRIREFHEKYPYVDFEIREGSTFEILELLKSGVVEIGVIRSPLDQEVFHSIGLTDEPMVAAVSDQSDWSWNKEEISLNELKDRPLLVHRRFENLITELCQQAGFEPRILCKIEDTRSILLLADSGMGVAIIPQDWMNLIPNTSLRYVKVNEPALITKTAVVWMKNAYLSSVARHFLETFQS